MGEGSRNEESLAPLAVEVKEMVPELFTRYFEVPGHLEAVQDAFISPEINGQIKSIAVKRGERVKKGDLLVKLNTDITEQSINEVQTSLELAVRVFEKQEELWDQKIGSEIQYLEAKNGVESLEARLATLEKQLAMAHVRAPFSGIVDDISAKDGELATPGLPLMHLVNLNRMRVTARISESYLNSVSEGDRIELSFDSYPDDQVESTISRLGQVIDQQTRTIALETEIDNPLEKYKPKMLTSLRIREFSMDNAMVVPSIILREDFQGTFLFVLAGDGENTVARKVYVTTGISAQDLTVITSGVEAGDRVIINGYNLVSDGSPTRITTI